MRNIVSPSRQLMTTTTRGGGHDDGFLRMRSDAHLITFPRVG